MQGPNLSRMLSKEGSKVARACSSCQESFLRLESHRYRPQDRLVEGLCGTCARLCCRGSNAKRNSTGLCPASQQQHAFRDKRRCKACDAKLRTGGSPNVANVRGQQTKRIRVHASRSKCRLTIVNQMLFPKRRCTVGKSLLANQVPLLTERNWKDMA